MVKERTRTLVLFDFDGTITTKDTLLEFLMFYRGPVSFVIRMLFLSPVLVAYLVKLIPNWKAKQIVLRNFFGGENEKIFNTRCVEFARKQLPTFVRKGALNAINNHKSEGATVAVVTASAENWVRPWCDENGILCIGTQLEVIHGKMTGNFCGANCHGPEKVKRIQNQFLLKDFDHIVAYGDSAGDKEMFSIAHKHHYKPFRSEVI